MKFFDEDKIYNSKTKEYFQEVISSYSIGNYRSAILTLYSVVICDLLFKLDELVDVYFDTKAMEILNSVNDMRENHKNVILSQWEGDLVHRIHKETKLMNDIAYKNFEILKWYRNVAAHPVLNDKYELYVPSQETVIALITNTLKDVLTKPSIFVKNVADVLTEDITKKFEIYRGDMAGFEEFLKRKYYIHMDDSMKRKLFLVLWKFAFVSDQDLNCMSNLNGLRIALLALTKMFSENELKSVIQPNVEKCVVSINNKCVVNLTLFLASCQHNIFSCLSEDTKRIILTKREEIRSIKLYCWFICDLPSEHTIYLRDNGMGDMFNADAIKIFVRHYKDIGCIMLAVDFLIDYYGNSNSFDCANERYDNVIRVILPYISTLEQYEKLFEIINKNDQIYNRGAAYVTNTEIVKSAIMIVPKEYDYGKYEHLSFNKKVLEKSDSSEFEEISLATDF